MQLVYSHLPARNIFLEHFKLSLYSLGHVKGGNGKKDLTLSLIFTSLKPGISTFYILYTVFTYISHMCHNTEYTSQYCGVIVVFF